MRAYYNDNDPYCVEVLERLVSTGRLPPGDVDGRSITEVKADDLEGYDQLHWFAGIGGWPLALAMAGWEGPVWTGSCPCQPFSSAGKRAGSDDPRHLWPAWFRLIRECRPDTVFGEQVPGAIGMGWLDSVSSDLEGEGYAVGSVVLGAHSVGAPHIRQRLWWVADGISNRRRTGNVPAIAETNRHQPAGVGSNGKLGHAPGHHQRRAGQPEADGRRQGEAGGSGGRGVADADGAGLPQRSGVERVRPGTGRPSEGKIVVVPSWQDVQWLPCADGKARPVKYGIHPLAHGVPGRVARLRAYGNAIVPQVAATFVRAFMS